jgi:hypothetical protein
MNPALFAAVWLLAAVLVGAVTDFSQLNNFRAPSAPPRATAKAPSPRKSSGKIAGIDVEIFDEINRRAVNRALQTIDFNPEAIARASFIEFQSGEEVPLKKVREAGLRSVTNSLRGSRGRRQVVYSLNDDPDATQELQKDLHITAFLEEAMTLTTNTEKDFLPSIREIANLLGFDEDIDDEGGGVPTQRSPPPPPAPHTRPSFVETEANAEADAAAGAGAEAAANAGAGAGAGGGAAMGAAAAARVAAAARARATAASGTGAGAGAANADPAPDTAAAGNPSSSGYTAPHAPPSFAQWLKVGTPGSGQTASNMGIDYKPDPRRHPPPPPVPSPPPPPPPPAFTFASPLASYR